MIATVPMSFIDYFISRKDDESTPDISMIQIDFEIYLYDIISTKFFKIQSTKNINNDNITPINYYEETRSSDALVTRFQEFQKNIINNNYDFNIENHACSLFISNNYLKRFDVKINEYHYNFESEILPRTFYNFSVNSDKKLLFQICSNHSIRYKILLKKEEADNFIKDIETAFSLFTKAMNQVIMIITDAFLKKRENNVDVIYVTKEKESTQTTGNDERTNNGNETKTDSASVAIAETSNNEASVVESEPTA